MTIKERANQIIMNGEAVKAEELRKHVKELKSVLEYGLARKILERASKESPEDVWVRQQLALCTYKDEELLPLARFSKALNILEELGLRDSDKADAETLGLGGAIYKQKWKYDGQIENLYQSLAFYRTGYERYHEKDKGYCGVNAAYILDLLASRAKSVARRTGTTSPEAGELERQAIKLREQMASEVPKLAETEPGLKEDYWFNVTVAEIHFGLGNYAEAGKWLYDAKALNPHEWELQTTFRQFVSIARLRGCEPPTEGSDRKSWDGAWRALCEMLGDETECALSCYRGKTGLALSGGGFRASFFHLGALARMAEMDVLRSIEALSTVSGGSIVGAHYYLELQKLLQTKPDKAIDRDDYIGIVKDLQKDFLDGVQKNLRTRAFADFANNLKMAFLGKYNLSHRLGELYERELYAKVQKDGSLADSPRKMNDLFITPKDWERNEPFKPRFHNWRRRAKVPNLVINATTLNTGHAWQFTASWMGEPPGLVGDEVDKNERCRRLYYSQAPGEEHRNYPLGYAVAASACVPGLFDPLVIDGLYPDRTIRLVDGGVNDNQGVGSLLDEQCTMILCSDASGQMQDCPKPPGSVVGVVTRSGSIQGDRIREAEYQDLRSRVDTKALQGLFFIHLKKDLPVCPVDWIGCDDPSPVAEKKSTGTPYGIDAPLQAGLAAIRTDLDSFTEVEANALMLSGYLMADCHFKELQKQYEKDEGKGKWGGFDVDAERRTDWPFLKLEPLMGESETSDDPRRAEIAKQLAVSRHRGFKVWRLDPELRELRWRLLGGAAVLGLLLAWALWKTTVLQLTLGQIVVSAVVALLAIGAPFAINPQRGIQDILSKLALAFVGYVSALLHIRFFDKRYLAYGSMERLLNYTGEPAKGASPLRSRFDALRRLLRLKTERNPQ